MADEGKQRHLLVISGDHEPAFSEFYQSTHIPDVLSVPGIVSGRHLELSDFQPANAGTGMRKFLTVFEIEGDPEEVFAALNAARAAGKIRPTPSEGRGDTTVAVFRPLTSLTEDS